MTAEEKASNGPGRATCVLLGHPIAHVRAPQAFNAWFEERSVDAVMVAADVEPEGLEVVLRGLPAWQNLAGIAVTMPHKKAIVPLLDDLTPAAARARSVNAVRRTPDGELIGTTFDGTSFVEGLLERGHQVRGAQVVVFGTGGAGSAIADALAGSQAATVRLANRHRERAEQLAQVLTDAHPGVTVVVDDACESADIVVNATSLGLATRDRLPFPVEGLRADAVVAEVVMQPSVTPLLRAAQARGLTIHEGHHMLKGQLIPSIDFFGLLPVRPHEITTPQRT